jgi:hypothetical protein
MSQRTAVREAKQSHAFDSPVPREGEDGCLFDEIQNLVEPDERPVMDDQAGLPSHGWRDVTERRGQTKNARPTKNNGNRY